MCLKLKIGMILFSSIYSLLSFAQVRLDIGIISKKGIDKGLILECELYSTEELSKNVTTLQMKNGLSFDLKAYEYNLKNDELKVNKVIIEGLLKNSNGDVIKKIDKSEGTITIGTTKKIIYTKAGHMIEITITPKN